MVIKSSTRHSRWEGTDIQSGTEWRCVSVQDVDSRGEDTLSEVTQD